MSILIATLILTSPGPAIFDQSLAAFRSRKAFSVQVALDATMNKEVTASRYSVAYMYPNKVLLRKKANGNDSLVFWFGGSKFIAYDPVAGEMTVRPAPQSGPLINRLANCMSGLEDPIAAQLSPTTMTAFMAPFKALTGWTTGTSGSSVVLTRTALVGKKRTLSQFEFAAGSKLLTRVLLVGPSSRLEWNFVYGVAPKTLYYVPPKGTKLVKSLTEHAKINASDPQARMVVDRSLRAYSRISSLAFDVTGSAGSSTDWMSGSSFRERRPDFDWTYHRGILTIKDLSRGKNYQGRCKPAAVISHLKALKRPMEPVLQALFTKQNPISKWFMPGTKVVGKGNVTLNGIAADAVEIRSPLLEVSLLVRRDNHLVTSVSSRIKDAGKTISDAQREFKYISVNQSIPTATFFIQVPRAQPLPKGVK